MFRLTGRPSKRFLFAAVALGLPALLWTLVRAIAPMGLARDRVASELAEQLGQPVALGSVRIGWTGGVVLHDLRIGPDQAPWLTAPQVRLDLCWLDLLRGRTQIHQVEIREPIVRLERDLQGQLNLLAQTERRKAQAAPSGRSVDPRGGGDDTSVAIRVSGGTLTWIDRPSRTELTLCDVAGSLSWTPDSFVVELLEGDLNGGRLALAANLDTDRPGRPFRAGGELQVSQAQIDPALGVLSYVLPLGSLDSLTTGRLDLAMRLVVDAPRRDQWREGLAGTGRLAIYDIEPGVSPLVSNLATQVGLPPRSRLGSLQGSFAIDGDGVATRDMRLLVGTFPVVFAGRTGFDGGLDYAVHAEGLGATIDRFGARLPDRARRVIRDLDLPKTLEGVADLHLGGHTGAPTLTLGRPGVDGKAQRLDAAAFERLAEQLRSKTPPPRALR